MFKNLYGIVFFEFVIITVCSNNDNPICVSSIEGLWVHNTAYLIHIYSPESTAFYSTTAPLIFSKNQIYQIIYAGKWGGDLFPSISGELEATGYNAYKGQIYISGNFTPSYGAINYI
jgi:hypothetical protein